MSEYACFMYNHFRGDRKLSGMLRLFDMIRERGIEPVISVRAEKAAHHGQLEVMRLGENGKTVIPAGRIALADVGVIFNRVDRALKLEQIKRQFSQTHLPPIINDNDTRAIGSDKMLAHNLVLGPLGVGIPTADAASSNTVEHFIDEHSAAEDFMIKPRNGSYGRHIRKIAKDDLAKMFVNYDSLWNWNVIQPYYNFTRPLPSMIEPLAGEDRDEFYRWNDSGAQKELRMYGYYSYGRTDDYAVAKSIGSSFGIENRYFLNQDSIPSRVRQDTRNVIRKVAQVTGAPAVFGAVDIGYGALPGHSSDWSVVELNLRTPYVVGYKDHPDVAEDIRYKIADQIQRTVSLHSYDA